MKIYCSFVKKGGGKDICTSDDSNYSVQKSNCKIDNQRLIHAPILCYKEKSKERKLKQRLQQKCWFDTSCYPTLLSLEVIQTPPSAAVKKQNPHVMAGRGPRKTGWGWQSQFLGQGTQWPVCDRWVARRAKRKTKTKTKKCADIPC